MGVEWNTPFDLNDRICVWPRRKMTRYRRN